MQFAFLIILIGALGAGILVLASMGFRQWRRRKALARAAHEMGMMFSAKDPFDLTRRYWFFVLRGTARGRRTSSTADTTGGTCGRSTIGLRRATGRGGWCDDTA